MYLQSLKKIIHRPCYVSKPNKICCSSWILAQFSGRKNAEEKEEEEEDTEEEGKQEVCHQKY